MIPLGVLAGCRSGPGAWTPADIANLSGWWDASAITGLSDTNNITTWTDLAGVSNMTASTSPTYRTNVRNSLPVARFSTTSHMISASRTTASSTLALVATVSGTGVRVQMWNGGIGNGFGPMIHSGNRGFYLRGVGVPVDGAYTNDTWERWIVTTGKAGRSEFWLNGTRVIDSASTQNTPSGGYARLGASENAEYMSGGMDLGEALIYNAALSDTDIGTLDSYLASKWGF